MIAALIPVTLLGALVGLDTVSFPQAMFARPIVAATLGGAMAGSPTSGLLLGATLELIALETLPFGASRYPEWGSASVVGGFLFASSAENPSGGLTLAIFAALATAWIGGWTMVKLRQRNAKWAEKHKSGLDAGARGTVVGLQLSGMTADLMRGAILSALSFLTFAPLREASLALWSVDARVSRAVAVGVAMSVAAAAAWKLFHGNIGARWFFAAGLAIGFTVLVLR